MNDLSNRVLAKGADGSTTKITIGHRQNAPSSLTSLLASNGLKDHHENLDLSSSSPMKRPKALRQQLLLDLGDELEQAKRLLEMSKAGS